MDQAVGLSAASKANYQEYVKACREREERLIKPPYYLKQFVRYYGSNCGGTDEARLGRVEGFLSGLPGEIMQKMGAGNDCSCRTEPCGSVHENIKVGIPNEYDYIQEVCKKCLDPEHLIFSQTTTQTTSAVQPEEKSVLEIKFKSGSEDERRKWGNFVDGDSLVSRKVQKGFKDSTVEILKSNLNGVDPHVTVNGPCVSIFLEDTSAGTTTIIKVDLTFAICITAARLREDIPDIDLPTGRHGISLDPLYVVPAGSFWRLSFTHHEKKLVKSLAEKQNKKTCIHALKNIRDKLTITQGFEKPLMTTYPLKVYFLKENQTPDSANTDRGRDNDGYMSAAPEDVSLNAQGNSNAQPEANLNAQPEASSNTKPEANLNAQLEASSNTQPEASSNTQPEANLNTQPEASSNAQPEASSNAQPEANSNAQPEASSNTQPEASSNAQPEASSNTQPAANLNTQPEASSNAQPEASSNAQPEASPNAQPEANSNAATVPDWSSRDLAQKFLSILQHIETDESVEGGRLTSFYINNDPLYPGEKLVNNSIEARRMLLFLRDHSKQYMCQAKFHTILLFLFIVVQISLAVVSAVIAFPFSRKSECIREETRVGTAAGDIHCDEIFFFRWFSGLFAVSIGLVILPAVGSSAIVISNTMIDLYKMYVKIWFMYGLFMLSFVSEVIIASLLLQKKFEYSEITNDEENVTNYEQKIDKQLSSMQRLLFGFFAVSLVSILFGLVTAFTLLGHSCKTSKSKGKSCFSVILYYFCKCCTRSRK